MTGSNAQLFVGGLPREIRDEELRDFVEATCSARLRVCRIARVAGEALSRGCAFIAFEVRQRENCRESYEGFAFSLKLVKYSPEPLLTSISRRIQMSHLKQWA